MYTMAQKCLIENYTVTVNMCYNGIERTKCNARWITIYHNDIERDRNNNGGGKNNDNYIDRFTNINDSDRFHQNLT